MVLAFGGRISIGHALLTMEGKGRASRPATPALGDTCRAMSEESTPPRPDQALRQAFGTSNRHDLDAIMSFFAPHAVRDRSASGL